MAMTSSTISPEELRRLNAKTADRDNQTPPAKLRRGWTTGTCATAACVAAFYALTGKQIQYVTVMLTNGKSSPLEIKDITIDNSSSNICNLPRYAQAHVIKDAGDDPDCTHRSTVWTNLKPSLIPGIRYFAGTGVGTVTKVGLPLEVGEPAINPGPRRMIMENLLHAGWQQSEVPGWDITIGIHGGEELATQTWNPKLGIIGGLSILGTSGIVIPYSCSAWLASIKLGLNVATAASVRHFAFNTGKTSLQWLKTQNYEDTQIIDMGDFVLGTCKLLRRHHGKQWHSLNLAGGIGKLCKLAQGHGDLHSRKSQVDHTLIANWLHKDGATDQIIQDIMSHTSVAQSFITYPRLASIIAKKACQQLRTWLNGSRLITVSIIDRSGALVCQALDDDSTTQNIS